MTEESDPVSQPASEQQHRKPRHSSLQLIALILGVVLVLLVGWLGGSGALPGLGGPEREVDFSVWYGVPKDDGVGDNQSSTSEPEAANVTPSQRSIQGLVLGNWSKDAVIERVDLYMSSDDVTYDTIDVHIDGLSFWTDMIEFGAELTSRSISIQVVMDEAGKKYSSQYLGVLGHPLKGTQPQELTTDDDPVDKIEKFSVLSTLLILAPLYLFGVSIFMVMSTKPSQSKFEFLVMASYLLTILMITLFVLAMGYAQRNGISTGRVGLGVAWLYQHSYVEDGQPDWVLSFTVPPKSSGDIANSGHGFGAPLWVIFMAVVGSGLLTVALILREIRDQPNEDDIKTAEKLRPIMSRLLQHQFFILFSPIGAIFVFQLLLGAGAAGHPVTVAFAALGAGAALNVILERGVQMAARYVDQREKEENETKEDSEQNKNVIV